MTDQPSASANQDGAEKGHEVPAHDISYRQIAETIPHLVWTTTPEGYHDYFNSRWEQYIGFTADETKGHLWHTFLHPDDQQRAKDVWSRCIATGAPYEIEYRFRDRNGLYRWFLARAMPIRDSKGNIVKWFGTCTDINEQKCAQRERSLLLVRERQSRKAAEEATQARDDLLATVSHELRTPLAIILGWSGLIERSSNDPERLANGLEGIKRSAHTLSKLVDDLLNVSQLIVGKVALDPQPVELSDVVKTGLESFRTTAADKQLALRIVHLEPITCMVDEARIHQVFSNLINNAVKFTEKGEVAVSLERVRNQAVLKVSDTGEGLSAEFLPIVFERFTQVDASAARSQGGMGLGLSIVQLLVGLHGGSITAQSKGLGHGSTFEVRLPITPEDKPLPRTSPRTTGAQSELQVDALAGITVLVVDDEDDIRTIVSSSVEDYGGSAISAASAAQAREVLTRTVPDVIICDIAMPGETGYQFADSLRAAGNHLPVLALTAYAQQSDITRAHEAGFDEHIAKPVEPRRLVRAVLQVTGR